MVKNGNFTLLLTTYWSRMAISHCYLVKNANFPLLVVKNGNFALLLTSSGQEWQFHTTPDIYMVKNGNFTLLLTSTVENRNFNGNQESISHCYWHLVVKNGNFALLSVYCGQEWQFHMATDIYWSFLEWQFHFALLLTSSCQEWQFCIATGI